MRRTDDCQAEVMNRRVRLTARLGRTLTVAKTDTDDSDNDADNRRPKRKEEQQTWAYRIRIGIRPQSNSRRDNDEYERTCTHDEQPQTEFNPSGLTIFAHAASSH